MSQLWPVHITHNQITVLTVLYTPLDYTSMQEHIYMFVWKNYLTLPWCQICMHTAYLLIYFLSPSSTSNMFIWINLEISKYFTIIFYNGNTYTILMCNLTVYSLIVQTLSNNIYHPVCKVTAPIHASNFPNNILSKLRLPWYHICPTKLC